MLRQLPYCVHHPTNWPWTRTYDLPATGGKIQYKQPKKKGVQTGDFSVDGVEKDSVFENHEFRRFHQCRPSSPNIIVSQEFGMCFSEMS